MEIDPTGPPTSPRAGAGGAGVLRPSPAAIDAEAEHTPPDRTSWDRYRPSPFPLPLSPSPAPASPNPGTPSTTGTSLRTPLRFSTSLSASSDADADAGRQTGMEMDPSLFPMHTHMQGFAYQSQSPGAEDPSTYYQTDARLAPGGAFYDTRDSRGELGIDVRTSLSELDPGLGGYPGLGGQRGMSVDMGLDLGEYAEYPEPPETQRSLTGTTLTDSSPPATSSSSGSVIRALSGQYLAHFWALPPTLAPVPAPPEGDNPYQTELHLSQLLAAYPSLGPVYISSTRWVEAWYSLCERRWVGGRYWPRVDEDVWREVRRSREVAAGVVQPKSQAHQEQEKGRRAQHYAFGEFEWSKTLGTGTFGRVHLVRSMHNARLFAIKVLAKSKLVSLAQVEHTNAERALLFAASSPSAAAYDGSTAGRCPFLVNLYGTWQDRTNVYMVMEYVSGGELFTLLRKAERFPVSVARFYAAEVVLALGYLHRMDIIYRDLKPENILLTPSGHIKLTDFGFAKYVPDITFTLCGTPDYLAPELIAHMPYTKSVDWYSLGILVYEMLVGTPPFVAPNPAMLYQRILEGRVAYPAQYVGIVEQAFLDRTMTRDLSSRYGHGKVSDKSRASVSSVSSLQGKDSGGSGTEDVMLDPFFAGIHWETLEGSAGEYFGRAGGIRVPWIPGEGENFERYNEVDFAEYNQPLEELGREGMLFPEF
ncbi:kinase-like protein [Calocera viscosa TUFC12733]|uniref:cAMP-dependent protein kinase n=1 Tax=Calocera viscosa (strain TUFC12733) TaxID=1330018 RepID=A0A167JS38_CALVF|nr:kinase-like protein [Calocera viscosa TUFC12733]